MRENYGLDRLVEYAVGPVPATVSVVNPARRKLDCNIRTLTAQVGRFGAQFAALSLEGPMEADPVARYQGQKSKLQERIGALRRDLDKLKIERKTMPKRVDMKDLPEPERFQRLLPERKHFVDTIKLIAYRAETSLASVLRDKLAHSDDARALLRQIFRTEVDLTPELPAKTLTLRRHHLAQNAHDIAVRHLCDHLNATETLFPGADLRVVDSDVLDCRSDGREAARWRGCTQRSRAGSSTSLRGGQQAPSREIVPESISGGSNHRLRHTICEMTVSP